MDRLDALCPCVESQGSGTGTWGHHIFKYLERYASQNKEYNVAFEHFLVLCCSFGVCKLRITGKQNLFSLWLTIV